MDRLIKRFDSVLDGDLRLCPHRGVAYQDDMRVTMQYDKNYFDKFASYDAAIADKLNRARIEFVNRHYGGWVLDIGVGCGAFVAGRPKTSGFDINPYAVEWLKQRNLYNADPKSFEAFTFWDVLEHVEQPEMYLKRVRRDGLVFVAVPIFDDLSQIRASKHYKPGEHLYYWTEKGFIDWMALYGFRCIDRSDHEQDCGRDSIGAFVFKRDLPQYHEFLVQYTETHAKRFYGASSRAYLTQFAEAVHALQPNSIMDFGCGRSDLLAHFWLDGARRLERYDPAIPEFKEMPQGRFDLVFCCDVMEHIRMADVDRIFFEIREKSRNAIFVISTRPARAVLPNGSNAHVTLLTESEWMRWIAQEFGKSERIPYEKSHLLMIKTF